MQLITALLYLVIYIHLQTRFILNRWNQNCLQSRWILLLAIPLQLWQKCNSCQCF